MKRLLLPLKLIGVGIFLWILIQIDQEAMLEVIAESNLLLLGLSFLTLLSVYFFKAIRFQILVHAAGNPLTIQSSWKLFLIGVFLSTITPGKLGDLGRAGYILNEKVSMTKAIGINILDRLLDVIVLGLLGIISMGYLFEMSTIALGATALFVGGFFLLWNTLQSRIERVNDLLRPSLMIQAGALTIIGWMAHLLWAVLIAYSIGMDLSVFVLSAALVLTSLINMIPIAPSGLGTREAALIFFLAPYGIALPEAVSLGLLMFLSIVLSSIFGAFSFLRKT